MVDTHEHKDEHDNENYKKEKAKFLFNIFIDNLFTAISVDTMCGAEKDFTCCSTCGHSEIEEVTRSSNGDKNSCYIFYHEQETNSINKQIDDEKEDINIYLSYGAFGIYDEEEKHTMIEAFEEINNYLHINNEFGMNAKLLWNKSMQSKMKLVVKNTLNEDNYIDYTFTI